MNTCGICKLVIEGKSLTTLECGCTFHPHCIHSSYIGVHAFCPMCKGETELSKLWDFGDDVDVDSEIRKRHPNAVTSTYPKGEVKRSLWVSPNKSRTFITFGKTQDLDSMILNYDAKVLRDEFGVTASHFSAGGFTFDNVKNIKSITRMDTLNFLHTITCTLDDLVSMDYSPRNKEETLFLKQEIGLFEEDFSVFKNL